MADQQAPPAGPDLSKGIPLSEFAGEMLLGHVGDEEVVLVRSGSEIFAIGDTAAVAGDQRIPGTAAAAKQMGKYVARVIAARLNRSEPPPPFRYRHVGDLATIGRKSAIVSLGRLRLTGFVGWLFWSVVHIYFLIGMRNRFVGAANWLWSYLTFKRSARLITTPK